MAIERISDDLFKMTHQSMTVHIEVNGTSRSTSGCTVFIEPPFIPYDFFLDEIKKYRTCGLWSVWSVTPIVVTSAHTCLSLEINRADGLPAGDPGQGLHEDEEGLRLLFEQLVDVMNVWISPR